jgi:hypothetical protein
VSALRDEQEGVTPPTPAPPEPKGEPEKLTVPASSVMWLLMQAFKTEAGDAWLRGFVTAHGEPSWIVSNQWGIKADGAEMVRVERPALNGAIPPRG